MKEVDVYLFGQILGTHSFLLKDGFLKPDEDTVRFASACSAVAISRFPLPLNPPKMDEVNELLR